MAQDDDYFRLRIPPDLKARVDAVAGRNNRSTTAEINHRLRASLDEEIERDTRLSDIAEKVDLILKIIGSGFPSAPKDD